MRELILCRETKHDGLRARFAIGFNAIHDFIPRAGDAEHCPRDGFIGTIVVLREKRLTVDDGLLTTTRKREIKPRFDRPRLATSVGGVSLDLLPAFPVRLRIFDVVQPAVTHPSDAAKAGLDIIRGEPDGNTAPLNGSWLQSYVVESGERATVRNVFFSPEPAHHLNEFFAHFDPRFWRKPKDFEFVL